MAYSSMTVTTQHGRPYHPLKAKGWHTPKGRRNMGPTELPSTAQQESRRPTRACNSDPNHPTQPVTGDDPVLHGGFVCSL